MAKDLKRRKTALGTCAKRKPREKITSLTIAEVLAVSKNKVQI
jgi:hypothetical protein